MKKKILVPTDFSLAAQSAYWYACELARVYDATLELIYVYNEAFPPSNIPNLNAEGNIQGQIKEQLKAFAENYPHQAGDNLLIRTAVNTRVVPGVPVSTLSRLSEQDDVFMIVMGATGSHGAADRLFGSVSSGLAQRAFCPVMLIPEQARYEEFEQILYATNFESADSLMLHQIIDFANIFRSALHFVHIENDKNQEDFNFTEDLIMKQLMDKGSPAFSFNMHTVADVSVLEGLHQYAATNEVQLIVLANRQRSLLESLLGQSMTKKMALRIKYPMLVYHMI
ncbi:MAG: universal stress protein [Bacteroidota bacterium]